jgi:phenylacetate-CoA ligase
MRRWLVWNIIFRLHESMKGHPTYRILRQMEAADRLSEPELEKLQQQMLQEFINYCYANVPYVKARMQEAGLEPSQICQAADLRRLPVMRKADVRRHREALRSRLATQLTPCATGGSTGEPLIFDLSKLRIASRVACRQRVSRWWGLSVGDPEFALWGAPVEVTRQDWIRDVRDRLLSTQLLSAFEMNEASMSEYLDLLEDRGCRQIFAYPSAIYLLCLHARKQRRNLRRLGVRVVFVTGEVLFAHQRELISETLQCIVANGYGGRDSGFTAHECPLGGMHVMADSVVVEIVDPEGLPVPRGKPGEIVVTDLYSHEAPFLRYATGDIGAWSLHRCACGRPLPLLESIDGRSNDSVVAFDGRIINSLALIYAVREIGEIEHFRIYQRRVDCFHVQIVPSRNVSEANERRIRNAWVQLLRSPLEVTFEYLPSLPPERSGKFRHVVSELPAGRAPIRRDEEYVPLM